MTAATIRQRLKRANLKMAVRGVRTKNTPWTEGLYVHTLRVTRAICIDYFVPHSSTTDRAAYDRKREALTIAASLVSDCVRTNPNDSTCILIQGR